MERADTIASGALQEEPGYQTIDENSKSNSDKAHNRKPSNGVQKQNKIISPVKHIERMATSGSFAIKESAQRKFIDLYYDVFVLFVYLFF